jgi:hypothetical protein
LDVAIAQFWSVASKIAVLNGLLNIRVRVDGRVSPLRDIYGHSSDQDESSNGMDKLQSAILAILDLYTDRDEEPFQDDLLFFTKLVLGTTD